MPYKHKEDNNKYQREWRAKNKEKWREILLKSDRKRGKKIKRIEQLREVRVRRHHRLKVSVLERYGKKCSYCGCNVYEFLCVDHINDDGAFHRKTTEYKRYQLGGMWGYLSKTEFRPDLYQILCYNCNLAKLHYKIKPGGNIVKSFNYWKEMSKKRYGKKNFNYGL